MRTHGVTLALLRVIGDARDFCAGNFALRARCKSRGELPSMHGMDAVSYLSTTAAYFCTAKIR